MPAAAAAAAADDDDDDRADETVNSHCTVDDVRLSVTIAAVRIFLREALFDDACFRIESRSTF